MNASNTTQAHGDAALGQAIEPTPKGRFGIRGFTMKAPPKREPFVPKPLVKRTPHVLPVDAVTESLAPHRRAAPLPTRTPITAVAMLSGSVVDAPGQAITAERIARPRGAETILAYLRGRHIEIALSTDRAHVVPRALSGKMFGIDRDLIVTTAPLLVAYLAGAPLHCTVGTHPKDVDDLAVTVAVGGCPMCQYHAAGGAS